MAPQTVYVTKTELYLKVKKPLLERQRRARINKCLDIIKELVAEVQNDDAILRMDKAEMLESVLDFIKSPPVRLMNGLMAGDSYRHGFMNAVNEVSRVMASTPGMNVNIGKAVMIHLGGEFNRLLNMPSKVSSTDRTALNLSSSSSSSSSTTTTPATTATLWRPW